MKRLLLTAFAALILVPAIVIGIELVREPGSDLAGAPAADPQKQVERGAYLARAGNCMACHTVRGGEEYAGGRPIVTPFGAIYAPNITPDDETGIGGWSADDFWRAIHNGKSKDGSFLYPAFPYPSYTRVTREDADAMFAYLRTLEPVRQENRDHDLRFPYNQRILLGVWRALYFRPGVYEARTDRSPEWNRGAYLVQGLGHCAACHTSRNALGASIAEESLS
ncbi:MAG: c-type cytochrome, partial [Noviherbaspirillum sp.]